MSECVVRMEMPVDYCPIGFAIVAKGYCPVAEKHGCDFDVTKERPDWCPIICALPEGHGRLGDLDKLEGVVNMARIRVMQNGGDTNPYWECGDLILQAPTLVPAERRAKDGTD